MPKDKPIIKNLSKIMTAKIIYVTYKGKNNVEKLDEFEYVYKDYWWKKEVFIINFTLYFYIFTILFTNIKTDICTYI